jgi:2-polyprenyl-6-methoxyphenol hydroxylase-like FAD-dependent oxidoreductase
MSARHAVVVGGGIGGLTSTVALHQRGWAVTLVEQAVNLDPVGSGLSLGPNALRALDVIGLGKAARELAVFQGEGGIRRADGRWLLRSDMRVIADSFGDPIVMALRAELVDLLVAALSAEILHTGTRVLSVDRETGAISTSNGELDADLVVAADGVHSAVRRALFPAHQEPRYSGSTTWRFVNPSRPDGFAPCETWGGGQVFGIMPMSGGRVYCYASAPAEAEAAYADEQAELLRRFGGWYALIGDLIRSADPAKILHNDVYWMSRPLPAFHAGKVALVGDAAHAMAPNLGQGACQAIEDAVVLADLAGTPDGLARYSAVRVPRTSMVVKRSRSAERLAAVAWPPLAVLRNGAIKAMAARGPRMMIKQLSPVANWSPPQAPGAQPC